MIKCRLRIGLACVFYAKFYSVGPVLAEGSRAQWLAAFPQADLPRRKRSLNRCQWQLRRVKFCPNFPWNPGGQGSPGSPSTEKVHVLFSANPKCVKKVDAALERVRLASDSRHRLPTIHRLSTSLLHFLCFSDGHSLCFVLMILRFGKRIKR